MFSFYWMRYSRTLLVFDHCRVQKMSSFVDTRARKRRYVRCTRMRRLIECVAFRLYPLISSRISLKRQTIIINFLWEPQCDIIWTVLQFCFLFWIRRSTVLEYPVHVSWIRSHSETDARNFVILPTDKPNNNRAQLMCFGPLDDASVQCGCHRSSCSCMTRQFLWSGRRVYDWWVHVLLKWCIEWSKFVNCSRY